MTPSVAAVVVTWNAETLVADCLASIPDGVGVVVVDNASTDTTVSLVRSRFPSARVLVNHENRGFAAAVNTGLVAVAETELVLLLNPDARLRPGALDHLVAFLETHARAGLVSALVVDVDGHPERSVGGLEPSVITVAVHELGLSRLVPHRSMYRDARTDAPERLDWVGATCVLVRRAAIEAAGPLDESYFLYCEDIDWCRRIRAAGWEVWREPRACAVHRGSASVRRAGTWVDEHRIATLDRYFTSSHGRAAVLAFRAARVAGAAVRAVAFGAAGRATGRAELVARSRQRARDARIAARLLARGGATFSRRRGGTPS